jgi:hypothetical protein
MCSANKQELCSVAGFTNEDPKKIKVPYLGCVWESSTQHQIQKTTPLQIFAAKHTQL